MTKSIDNLERNGCLTGIGETGWLGFETHIWTESKLKSISKSMTIFHLNPKRILVDTALGTELGITQSEIQSSLFMVCKSDAVTVILQFPTNQH